MGRATTVLSAVFLAIGGFLFGYDSGIIGSTIALPTFVEYFGKPSDTTTGGIVSAFQGGAIFGTIINMFLADWLGRRRTIFAGSAVSCLGAAIQAGSANIAMMIVGRFIGGTAVGMLTSTIPLYAAELSEAKFRGILSGLLQWMLSWGFLVAQWLGYGCSFVSTSFSCESLSLFWAPFSANVGVRLQGASLLRSSLFQVSSCSSASFSSTNLHAGSWKRTSKRRPGLS
jgi:MFS family permease